jgi:hypothetical protein
MLQLPEMQNTGSGAAVGMLQMFTGCTEPQGFCCNQHSCCCQFAVKGWLSITSVTPE